MTTENRKGGSMERKEGRRKRRKETWKKGGKEAGRRADRLCVDLPIFDGNEVITGSVLKMKIKRCRRRVGQET